MTNESLAAEVTVGANLACRQCDQVLPPGFVLGGAADFDDFEARRGLQNPMADGRRLQDAIPGLHDEGRALVFVDHPHPTAAAIDELESDMVVVHVVGNDPAFGYPDRGYARSFRRIVPEPAAECRGT